MRPKDAQIESINAKARNVGRGNRSEENGGDDPCSWQRLKQAMICSAEEVIVPTEPSAFAATGVGWIGADQYWKKKEGIA